MRNGLIYKRIHPPTIWRNTILDDVKIAFRNNLYVNTAPLSSAASHQKDYLGLALPKDGLLVWPEVISLPWGSSEVKCISGESMNNFYNTLVSGATNTLTCFNATPANQGLDCAIGYAHRFERMVNINGDIKGIKAGDWYIPHPSELMMVIWPNIEKLKYAASLFGFTWPDVFWGSSDMSAADKGYRLNCNSGNTLGSPKTSLYGVLMVAKLTVGVSASANT